MVGRALRLLEWIWLLEIRHFFPAFSCAGVLVACSIPSCLSCIGVAKIVFDSNFTKPILMFQCFLVDKFSSSQWAIIMKPEIINEYFFAFMSYFGSFFFPLNFAFFFFPFPRYSLPLTYSNLHTLTILKKCILTRECERREQFFN